MINRKLAQQTRSISLFYDVLLCRIKILLESHPVT